MQHYVWRKGSQVAMMPCDIFTIPGEEGGLISLCAVYLGGGLATTPPPLPLCYTDIYMQSQGGEINIPPRTWSFNSLLLMYFSTLVHVTVFT